MATTRGRKRDGWKEVRRQNSANAMRVMNKVTGKLLSPQGAPAEAWEEKRRLDLHPAIQRQRDGARSSGLEGRTASPLRGGAAGLLLLL